MESPLVTIQQSVDSGDQAEESPFEFDERRGSSFSEEDGISGPNLRDLPTDSISHHEVYASLDRIEVRIMDWLGAHSRQFLRGSLGIVFLWFGALKFIPGLSPAQGIAVRTIHALTFGLIPPEVSLVLLATVECAIGIGFLTGRYMRVTLVLMAFQMAGTLTPLVLFPGMVFAGAPYALTLEGQYIIKDLVLIGGGMVIAATLDRGRIVTAPNANRDG
jgi:uncharacterized membrane protein YkgB